MKKLFAAIRHYDLDAVKEILSGHPEALDEAAVPPPKKDCGQSPLQVAIKISAFNIAEYLIAQGADVNFMEREDAETSLRCPLLHDAIGSVMFFVSVGELQGAEEVAESVAKARRSLAILSLLCGRGADVEKVASNGHTALNCCVHAAERVLDNPGAYPPYAGRGGRTVRRDA